MIDEIFNSLEGARRAEPASHVYEGVLARINPVYKHVLIRSHYVALAAACLTLLISANIMAFKQRSSNTTAPTAYQTELANFDLYSK